MNKLRNIVIEAFSFALLIGVIPLTLLILLVSYIFPSDEEEAVDSWEYKE